MKILSYVKSHVPTKQSVKFLYQRITRGWDDSETFSMDYSLAKIILPRLERFKELTIAHPANMSDKEWNKILDEMIWGFEWIIADVDNDFLDATGSFNKDLHEKHFGQTDRAKAAMGLFGKHYTDLWW